MYTFPGWLLNPWPSVSNLMSREVMVPVVYISFGTGIPGLLPTRFLSFPFASSAPECRQTDFSHPPVQSPNGLNGLWTCGCVLGLFSDSSGHRDRLYKTRRRAPEAPGSILPLLVPSGTVGMPDSVRGCLRPASDPQCVWLRSKHRLPCQWRLSESEATSL